MTEDLRRIEEIVARFASRERRLLAWQLVARALLLVAVGGAIAALAVFLELPRPQTSAAIVLWLGVGLWLGVAQPFLRRFPQTSDLIRQARLLEARDETLSGRLITAVDRLDGPAGGESPEILAYMAKRAGQQAEQQAPEEVHPTAPTRRSWSMAALMGMVAAGLWISAPGGASGAWSWWFGEASAATMVEAVEQVEAGAMARVGDLTLRYVYPDYTGLEPYAIENSTGEAHAPPGTRVEVFAKAAAELQAASLVAYDQPALDAEIVDGRGIKASFIMGAEVGTYQLVTHEGGVTRTSKAFPIVPEPDLAPEVNLDVASDVLEWPVDAFLDLRWAAKDDYGISSVELEIDGKQVPPSLRRPRKRLADVAGVLQKRPQDLGMIPGESYEVRVGARDNDTIAGPKMGWSQTVRLVILGEDGVAELTEELRYEVLGILVDLLADHLEDRFPPGARESDYARWGEEVNEDYGDLAAFFEAYRGRGADVREWGSHRRCAGDRPHLGSVRASQLPPSIHRKSQRQLGGCGRGLARRSDR